MIQVTVTFVGEYTYADSWQSLTREFAHADALGWHERMMSKYGEPKLCSTVLTQALRLMKDETI